MDLAELENNNREQLVDEDDSTSKELLSPVSIQNIAKDPCSSPTAADEDEADEDESQDDFGDFEEAAPVPIAAEEHMASTSQSYHQHQQVFPSFACLSLARLADLAELWQPPADEDDSYKSDCNQPCAIDDEIFRKMDLGSEADDSKLDVDMLKAFHLWLQICYVEETKALQFQWLSSQTHRRHIWALQMKKKSRPKSSVEKEQNMQSSGMSSEVKQNSANNSQENRNFSKTPAPVVDSLMVPPANFDWTSSGLANPLTGKAVKEAATFDCSFLLDGGNKNGTALNSTAILERDLQALGLVSTPAEQR